MQDCRAEVSSLIKGSDRYPKLGNQQLRAPVQCCCLQPPLDVSCSSWWSISDKLMSWVICGSSWLGFHLVEANWMQKHFLERGQQLWQLLGLFPFCTSHISWATARSGSWVCGNLGFHNKPLRLSCSVVQWSSSDLSWDVDAQAGEYYTVINVSLEQTVQWDSAGLIHFLLMYYYDLEK